MMETLLATLLAGVPFVLILFGVATQSIPELNSVSDMARNVGLATALVGVIVGGFREWYVWGPSHRREVSGLKDDNAALRAEVTRWQNLTLTGVTTIRTAVETTDHLVRGDPPAGR